jgi:hypothetical protein
MEICTLAMKTVSVIANVMELSDPPNVVKLIIAFIYQFEARSVGRILNFATSCTLCASFLLGLCIDPENGVHMFLSESLVDFQRTT